MSSDDNPPNRVDVDSWDPYEVWLKRVKQPRDRQSPRDASAERPVDTMQVDARDGRRVTDSPTLLTGVT